MNSKYNVKQTSALAKNILKRSGTVLIVWERNKIADIAAALGAKTKFLNWPGNDYDSVWMITIHGSKATLARLKEKLGTVVNCNFYK